MLRRYKRKKILICILLPAFYTLLALSVLTDEQFLFTYRKSAFSSAERNKHLTKILNYPSSFFKKEPQLFDRQNKSLTNLELLILVKSFALNYGQRNAIRLTWGHKERPLVRTCFVIGELKTKDPLLAKEFELYNDILVLGLEDTYTNLVSKTILTMLWIQQTKIQSKYFHLIDDDRILNIDNLLMIAHTSLTKGDLKIIGHKLTWTRPRRKPKGGKNVLSLKEYNFIYYPPYIIGGTLLTNFNTIRVISKGFGLIKLIPIEDIYIGVISYSLSIELQHESWFLPYYESSKLMHNFISSPGYDKSYELIHSWKRFLDSHHKQHDLQTVNEMHI